ncbi:MAG: thioredoxin family protein [Candidatus Micrarchaeota archaeon]
MTRMLTQDPAVSLKKEEAAVVVFCASWCGDCWRSLDYEKKLAAEFSGKAGFYRMDAEEFEAIADKYGVERYPTYVFFEKGKPRRGILVEPVAEGEARNWVEMQLSKKR